MAVISGDTLEGVSTTTLWTLHNHGTEAKRSDGTIRDPWAVTLLDAISYDYLKFGKPDQSCGEGLMMYLEPDEALGLICDCAARSPDEGLALADTIPGVRAVRDIKMPPGRGVFKLVSLRPFDRGFLGHLRPSITLLGFDR